MPHRKKQEKDSTTLRIASAMHAMGIEGLPRNYELVYDIYTGVNMELVREFKALGIYKSQHALDELGRKYLPHHFAVDEMEEHAGRIKEEMNALLGILEEEKSSLARYGELVGAAITNLASGSKAGNTALNESMTVLSAATLQRQMRTSSLSEQVAGQKANLDAVRSAIHTSEAHKFTDQLTGLGNRRMFNRELAAIFKTENNIPEFAVLVTEVDNAGQFTDQRSNVRDIARNAARVIRSCLPADVLLCRFDGFRFGMIYKKTERQDVADLAGRIQQSMAYYASGVKAAQNQLSIAVSIGVCMYSKAADAFDIVSLAERALREAQASGVSAINFYEGAVAGGQAKNLSLYNYKA